jgi:hypothetical protein
MSDALFDHGFLLGHRAPSSSSRMRPNIGRVTMLLRLRP